MPPKAKPTAPPSDADVLVASSIRRKTRNRTKNGETSDVEARPAKISRKSRNQKKVSSKAEDLETVEISKAASSLLYGESDSRTSPGTGSERGKTLERELAHVEEVYETHAMQSNSLESSANETAPPEDPRETPRLFGSNPFVQVAGAQKACHVLPHPTASQYLHPMDVRSSFHVLVISCKQLLLRPQARLADRFIRINASTAA